jgi:hypothetical protein
VSWAVGIYVSCAGIWAIVWGVSAAISLSDWRTHREGSYRKEKADEDRGSFLGSMLMLAATPVWPVPMMVFTYRGVRNVARDVKQASIEEAAEALRKKEIQDGR